MKQNNLVTYFSLDYSQERAVQEDSWGDSNSREPPESCVTYRVLSVYISWEGSVCPPLADDESDYK